MLLILVSCPIMTCYLLIVNHLSFDDLGLDLDLDLYAL